MEILREASATCLLLLQLTVTTSGQLACPQDGAVRLSGGETTREGRVEICYNGQWGTVCDHFWDTFSAHLVCSQLGLPAEYAEPLYEFGGGAGQIHRYEYCYLDSDQLSECVFEYNTDLCRHSEDAGVICHNVSECVEEEVRLVGGRTEDDGRVQVCLNGLWGSVCDDQWDIRDATVVCRQLGYDGPSYPLLSHDDPDKKLFNLDNVNCTGEETTLTQCQHNGVGNHDCTAGLEDAGVICTNVTCVDGTVHLVGGDDVTRGRVEYCYNGAWHSVCGNGWASVGPEARAVCGTLLYDTPTYSSVVVDYGRGSSPILPLRVRCASGTNRLSDCEMVAKNLSSCSSVAGVDCRAPCVTNGLTDCDNCQSDLDCYISDQSLGLDCSCYSDCFSYGDCCSDISLTQNCFDDSECESGSVRLVGGVSGSVGRLEFCANGMWGRVCNRLGYWELDNAMVVCRQLGFSTDGAYVIEDANLFGVSSLDLVIGEVHCIGTEPGLLECSHGSIGYHLCSDSVPDIAISCYDERTSCTDGDVRLSGGPDPANGYVEFCQHRTWGRVCREGWELIDTRVVCQQLGYNADDAELFEELTGGQAVPFFLGSVDCTGFEQDLLDCQPHLPPPDGGCTASAAVSCERSSGQPRCSADNQREIADNYESYGECSVYTADASVCSGVVKQGIDYVYARSRLGNQSTIAQLLNKNAREIESVIDDHDKGCVNLVYRFLCQFYLPSCGNSTHPVRPSSICQKECDMVRKECSDTWDVVMLAFKSVSPTVDCTDTSNLLFPVAHCCTGAGLGSNSPRKRTSNEVTGAVVGVVVFILLAALLMANLALLLLCLTKRHKRKQLERMQLDILAIPGHESSMVGATSEPPISLGSGESEPEEKETPIGAFFAGPNPYSEPLSTKPQRESSCSLQVSGPRGRVPSYHMRELARGKFLVKSEDIELLQCIGEGEFGIVYKGRLGLSKREVAVKTLKGDFHQTEVDKFVEESLKMSRFKHSHVMGLLGVCLDSGSAPYIIMPYMANGSLLKYLKGERKNIVLSQDADEDEVREVGKRLTVMCSQIASGMEYLAADKYVHRDLAARNCMIDAHFVIKITDFGLSEDVFERNYFRQGSTSGEVVKLPVKWMAPESLSDGHFSEKSDVWSYGVTMWEIFSGGKAPYPGTDPLTLMQSLEQGHRMPQPLNSACSQDIYGVMRQCWQMEPSDRPTFTELSSTLSKTIERIAGYLQIDFNPFTAPGDKGGGEADGEEIDSGLTVQVIPPSLQTNTAYGVLTSSD